MVARKGVVSVTALVWATVLLGEWKPSVPVAGSPNIVPSIRSALFFRLLLLLLLQLLFRRRLPARHPLPPRPLPHRPLPPHHHNPLWTGKNLAHHQFFLPSYIAMSV